MKLLVTLCHLFIKSCALLFPCVCAKLRLIVCWWECDAALSHKMRGYYRIVIHAFIFFMYIRPNIPPKHTEQNRPDLSVLFF